MMVFSYPFKHPQYFQLASTAASLVAWCACFRLHRVKFAFSVYVVRGKMHP